jgi:hypothetical protein
MLEGDLESGWNESRNRAVMPWEHARDAVKDSYERTVQIRRERDRPERCDSLQEN